PRHDHALDAHREQRRAEPARCMGNSRPRPQVEIREVGESLQHGTSSRAQMANRRRSRVPKANSAAAHFAEKFRRCSLPAIRGQGQSRAGRRTAHDPGHARVPARRARPRLAPGHAARACGSIHRALAALFDRARYDAVLISDSNVRVGPAYLREMAAEMADPAVGLVTNIVVGEGAGLGALLERLHLNSFVVAATSLARVAAGRACVIGKSMLLRRSDLERLGGLYEVRNLLAEDFAIGRMYEVAGFRVALSPYLVRCVNDGWTVERFLSRHVRWAQMRRRTRQGHISASCCSTPCSGSRSPPPRSGPRGRAGTCAWPPSPPREWL